MNTKNVHDKATHEGSLKLSHSFNTQLKPLRSFLYGLHLNILRDATAAQSFSDYIVNGVLHEGNGFLKLHRGILIQGLKVLGGDEPSFDGFKVRKGLPYPYGMIFRRLIAIRDEIISDEVLRDTVEKVSRETYTENNRMFVREVRTPHVIERVQSIANLNVLHLRLSEIRSLLTLLNWPRSIRLEHNTISKREILESFAERITTDVGQEGYKANLVGEGICRYLYEQRLIRPPDGKLSVNLGDRTYKGRRDIVGKIPECLAYIMADEEKPVINYTYVDTGPVGKATVLSERAGKSRVIVGSNGLINCTDLYQRARHVLDKIRQDYSSNQSLGHDYVRSLTVAKYELSRKNYLTIPHNGEYNYSVDLKEFTDKFSLFAVIPILESLGARDFLAIVQAPIVVNDRVVRPHKLLMGLRGTFEVASIGHHGLIGQSTDDYAIVGDDLAFRGTEKQYNEYLNRIRYVGLEVNKIKTIRSRYLSLFCGKVFMMGLDISPISIPLYTLVGDDPNTTLDVRSRTFGTVIATVKAAKLDKGVRKHVVGFLVKLASRFSFLGKYIPKDLPARLGGFGVSNNTSLLEVVERRRNHKFINLPVNREFPKETVTRRYIPWVSPNEIQLFPWSWNLLVHGAYKRNSNRNGSPVRTGSPLKDIARVLEYFYGIGEFQK